MAITMVEARAAFMHAVNIQNTKFTQSRSSIDEVIKEIDLQMNVGVPDAGRMSAKVNLAIRDDPTRTTKYSVPLTFLKETWWKMNEAALIAGTALEYHNVTYRTDPTVPGDASPEVKLYQTYAGRETHCLTFKNGKAQFELVPREGNGHRWKEKERDNTHVLIEDRSGRSTTSKDALSIQWLVGQTVRIVRAYIREGTLNNTMGGANTHNYTTKTVEVSKWGGRVNKTVQTPVPGFITALSPAALAARIETMRMQLGATRPGVHVQMAGMGLAPRLVGGAVCAMLAHVTAGVLTTIAEKVKAMVVFDCMYDHSYVVVAKGDSQWYAVDPWVQAPAVVPWGECYFPQADAKSFFEIEIKSPVIVPYGVNFAQAAINNARAVTSTLTGCMDGTYGHTSNEDRRPYRSRFNPALTGAQVATFNRCEQMVLNEGQDKVDSPPGTLPPIATGLDWGRTIFTTV